MHSTLLVTIDGPTMEKAIDSAMGSLVTAVTGVVVGASTCDTCRPGRASHHPSPLGTCHAGADSSGGPRPITIGHVWHRAGPVSFRSVSPYHRCTGRVSIIIWRVWVAVAPARPPSSIIIGRVLLA